MRKSSLLHCPHCGHVPWLWSDTVLQLVFIGWNWSVRCFACGASGPKKRTRAAANAAWNERCSETVGAEHGN